jgi:hypothetical protein
MRRFRPNRRREREHQAEWTDEPSLLDQFDMPDETPGDETSDWPYGEYDETPIEPFVPVSGDFQEGMPDTGTAYPERESDRPASRPRFSGRAPDLGIQWGYLLLALALIAAGIFGTLLSQDRLRGDVAEWWPVSIVVVAALWMIIALARRQIASFLGGAALAGIGLSLVMNNQDIADFRETALGMALVTVGLGIVIRGFLLRQQHPL